MRGPDWLNETVTQMTDTHLRSVTVRSHTSSTHVGQLLEFFVFRFLAC